MDFLEKIVTLSLGLKKDQWKRCMSVEENLQMCQFFLEKDDHPVLYVTLTASGHPEIATEFKPSSKNKTMYFIKKGSVKLTEETIRKNMCFGDLSPTLLDQFSVLVGKVTAPVLISTIKHYQWPDALAQDIKNSILTVKTKARTLLGHVKGQTILPLPADFKIVEQAAADSEERGIAVDKNVVYLLETTVVNWSKMLFPVIKKDPKPLQEGKSPPSNFEFVYWKNRYDNFENICCQFDTQEVHTIMNLLEIAESSFYPLFLEIEEDVFSAFEEAEDICMYLKPLQKWFEDCENQELPQMKSGIVPLMHTVCLVWTHSKYFKSLAHFVLLLQGICSFLMHQARVYLIPDDLLRGEIYESLQRVDKTMEIMQYFRNAYDDRKANLGSYQKDGVPPEPWNFSPEVLFAEVTRFTARVKHIQDILMTALDMSRLEDLTVGGIRGYELNEQIYQLHLQFQETYKVFQEKTSQDCLDMSDSEFEEALNDFKLKVDDMDRQLGTIFCQAYDDAATLENSFKVLDMFGTLLKRPFIAADAEGRYSTLLTMFDKQLDNCKLIYNIDMEDPHKLMYRSMPPIAGRLKWIQNRKESIELAYASINESSYITFDSIQGIEVVQKYEKMIQLLDKCARSLYESWTGSVGELSQYNLNLPLLIRDPNTRLIAVNFSQQLVTMLKEVDCLRITELQIPDSATQVYSIREMLWKFVDNLKLIAFRYNTVIQMELTVEGPLVYDQIEEVEVELKKAEEALNWNSEGVWQYIQDVRELVCDLESRLQRTKENMEEIKSCVKSWATPMFFRKKGKKDSLLALKDRPKIVERFYDFIKTSSEKIFSLVKSNQELLKADPHTDGWKAYVKHVDGLVAKGFHDSIMSSLKFFLDNTEDVAEMAPLYQVKLELVVPNMVFTPSMESGSGDGLYDIFESLINEVFSMASLMPRLSEEIPYPHYQEQMENSDHLAQDRQSLLKRVENTIAACEAFRNSLNRYSYLYVDDRKDFIRRFLLFGGDLKSLEIYPESSCPTCPPTLENFREQLDNYDDLYKEVQDFDAVVVIHGWLRVDSTTLKSALLNLVKLWSYMFKQHLTELVAKSLSDLETFITVTKVGLSQKVNEADSSQLPEIMTHLLAFREKRLATDTMFEPLQETVSLLKEYDEELPDVVHKQLAELPDKWYSLKQHAMSVKEKVAPLQAIEVAKLRQKFAAFDAEQYKFRDHFRKKGPFRYDCKNAYRVLDEFQRQIQAREITKASLVESAKLFEFPISENNKLKHCRHEVGLLKELWDMISAVESSIASWKLTSWTEIVVDDMELELKNFSKEIRGLDNKMKNWDAFKELNNSVKNMLLSLRAVSELQNPAMREWHWHQLMTATGVSFTMDQKTTLGDLLQLNLHNFEEEVKEIVDRAVKEMGMEKVLSQLNSTWKDMEFQYEPHHRTQVPLLRTDEELIDLLEDNQVQLQNLMTSKYITYFLDEVSSWQSKLSMADSVISIWFEVQRAWSHLESIFIGSEDICRQLPQDTERFRVIDTDFKELAYDVHETPNVVEATNKPGLLKKLEDIQARLSLCEKALAEYLDTKRLTFPRFYFISSADLLDILSNGTNPHQIQKHLSKLFDNVGKIKYELDKDENPTKTGLGMYSKEDEYVAFENICECTGQVEVWLNRVLDSMRDTVRYEMSKAVVASDDKPREVWLFNHPAQASLACSQICWTSDVNMAFVNIERGHSNSLKDYYKKQVTQLNALITMLIGQLTPGDRQKVMTICTIDVHARDVVDKMIAQKVETAQDFLWVSQLRHCWNQKDKHCYANICDAQFLYSYEYLGNTPRLVITPLTDRCYITLTQALHLNMSGAPAGPAGTGKTETTKDLGRALGTMVYVFNCSEQMDYRSCGNIYKGLAQTGAWGCFDEFNRISVEVLSVVSAQVKSIQDAIREKKKRFNFMGEEVNLCPSVGIFITMNPGYAGRTELPENLKALFRPCAMVVPDFELISEIMMVAEGFIHARILARKFITLYTLCKELLSKQDHYDWGLRAIKSVLVVAGSLKRGDPDRAEDQVLMRALRDFNVPKIVTDDMPVFMGLIGDLFPALDVPRKVDLDFEKHVREAILELKLQAEDNFVLKVVQLQELLVVRHSVFVIGNAGTGKSQVLKSLNKTYKRMKLRPVWSDLNPKAVTNDELFGIISPATREWKDGLFSCIMRDLANITHNGPKWIVLDGDIDPMWIESLNTVMDDNKVLTLTSNERITLNPTMRLVFEISHLRTATPATVSRAGILYINPTDLGWNPQVTSWIDKMDFQAEKASLTILFDKYLPSCLEVLRTLYKKIIPIPEQSLVQMLCYLLECLLTPENTPPNCNKELYELYFVFAAIWAFGGALSQSQMVDYRVEFSKWWLAQFKTIKFPATGTVFDYYVDPESKKFEPWSKLIPRFEMDPDVPLQACLVHTIETIRIRYFMDHLLEKSRPVMLVGNAGTGKSVLVGEKLGLLDAEKYMVKGVPLNYYTTSLMLQAVLEKPLEKKVGRNYGPPGNRRLIYFIDDMNIPEVDTYGTVQAHTLVRQHLDYGHWYDRNKLLLKDIHNVQYVACMNPTAGSFTINPRLQRHFSVFALSFPGQDALVTIYNSILSQHLSGGKFSAAVQSNSPTIVMIALALHQVVSTTYLPSAVKFHYVFNLRDISNIFQGILFCTSDCAKTPDDLLKVYLHEASRVYRDKFVDEEEIIGFERLQTEIVKKFYEDKESTLEQNRRMNMYCHFAGGLEETKYAAVESWAGLSKVLMEALDRYNEVNATLNLVLFEDAMSHICRINRILESPRGNALLVGVGGSGKQSLTRLAAFISNLEVFQITLRKGYGIPDLKADLAGLYMKSGVKNTGTVFLMTDGQMADEKFLVLVNDLLATGEIPDLFPDDEVENIINSIRPAVRGAGEIDTRENCWKFFIDRVRRQLKVVLCFSPVGSKLRVCGRKFPAVVNRTTIVWFHEWPQKALESVSIKFLQEVDIIESRVKESVGKFMAYVHTSVNQISKEYLLSERRYNYTTPKSFLEQITLYQGLLGQRSRELIGKMERLESGLDKFASATAQVDELKEVLAVQQVEVTQKKEDADKLIEVVGVEKEKVSCEKAVADEEETKVAAIEVTVTSKKEECEEDLKNAQPALDAAVEALNTLNKANLTELKTFSTPPDGVEAVTGAVMVLTAHNGKIPKDCSWKAARVMMGNVDQFLAALKNFDRENIAEPCLKAVRPYLLIPGFKAENISSKSKAAAGLCSWVINIVNFYDVYCDVKPKQQALKAANDELEAAQKKLRRIRDKIKVLDDNLAKLTAQFEKALADKLKCQRDAETTEATISQANRLMGGLASEKVRWAEDIANFKKQESTMCGDVLLITAFISYAGYFSKHYRYHLMETSWRPYLSQLEVPISVTPDLDPLSLLTDDADIATWQNDGLPADRMSTENATILIACKRWPFMVDPQLQGIKWIKNKYGEQLRVIRTEQRGYLDVLERAVGEGDVVLIENLGESLDPVLGPLLSRETIKKGRYIKIGDKECEYNQNFRLIMHTKLANPHYQPELQAQCTLINFTVTRDGLEDQLLAAVVSMERPDLEEKKSDLTKQQNQFKITLKGLEDDLLSRLSSASGNFLGDKELVENLERNKRMAEEIELQVREAKVTEAKINETRENYRPAAARASLLYFIMNDLDKIHPMYQFSLKAFSVVFQKAVRKAEPNDDQTQRVLNLTDSITSSVFQYTTRGLFECDRLMYVTQLTFQILLKNNEIKSAELDFLLRCPVQPDATSPVDFLSNLTWGGIKSLSAMEEFRSLDQDIESASVRWKKFVEAECPEKEKFPQEWKNKTALQRLCMMRVLRPDRMTYAVRDFVEEKLGSRFTSGRSLEFAVSFEETDSATPMFFILSPGVDPLQDVERHGKKLGYTLDDMNLHNVSLGQGQEVVAERALELASKEGHWVILQNIHLVARWLATLEKLVEQCAEDSHEKFRLFFSAEPSASAESHIIPQGILENSIKITNEPPTGMHANLHKALDLFNQSTLEMCTQENEFKSIWFALCYFHAVVTERRKFGPQGWNRSYPFNNGDLTISVNVLYNYLNANPKVPYADLRYLFGEIMYGGHITDDWDRCLCRTYLQEYIKPEMMEGEMFLAPNFLLPGNMDYNSYHQYIDDNLPSESPYLYGLHPNAEIGFLTQTSENLFRTVLEMQPRDAGAGQGGGLTREEQVSARLEDILEKLPDEFNMPELLEKAGERTPYQVVALQECERMNMLTRVIKGTLHELSLGLKGELSMTSDMESLQNAIFLDTVPESWTKRAYPSMAPLAMWFTDLLNRIKQLETWSMDFLLPSAVWLAGFFNPQSFLTAIMQTTARKNQWPLDRMTLHCDVTKRNREDFSSAPREGAYIYGLFMEGAQWDTQTGMIVSASMKELTPSMPVIFIKAVPVDKQETRNVYQCPVYRTRQRGPTYVWTFKLKTKENPSTWTVAGVALLLQI